MTGAPTFIAWSMILQIFSACASRQRAAEHGEVLAEDEDQPAVDRAVAGDHAVARDLLLLHAEIGAAMLDEHVPFLEGAGVEQQLDALAGGELALGVLGVDAALAAAGPRRRALLFELAEDFLHDPSFPPYYLPPEHTRTRTVLAFLQRQRTLFASLAGMQRFVI